VGYFILSHPVQSRRLAVYTLQFRHLLRVYPLILRLLAPPFSCQFLEMFQPSHYGCKFRNFQKFVNYQCQSVVSKPNVAKCCCKISMLLTNISTDLYVITLCIVFRQNILLLSRLPGISANSNENYRRYNLQALANIFGKFPEICGNIKFPENLQPYFAFCAFRPTADHICDQGNEANAISHCCQAYRHIPIIYLTLLN